MTTIQRLLCNISTEDLESSKTFYLSLFDLAVTFDSDWFIQLRSRDQKFEIGLISRSHKIVHEQVKSGVGGMYLTFVVGEVEEVHLKAVDLKYKVLSQPTDTFYGQRRMLLEDPNGNVLDISSVIKNDSVN